MFKSLSLFFLISFVCSSICEASPFPLPGFQAHLREAIAINKTRKPIYKELSRGTSRKVSRRLIRSEQMILPLAWIIDQRAKPFQKQGILIVADDFVPMHLLPTPETRIPQAQIADDETWDQLSGIIRRYQSETRVAIRERNLDQICQLTANCLAQVEALEKDGNCHFIMYRHVLESIGFMALHGKDYLKQSEGDTFRLTKHMIRWHLRGLSFCFLIDRPAQVSQAQGVGVLVNDLPAIPFLEEFS